MRNLIFIFSLIFLMSCGDKEFTKSDTDVFTWDPSGKEKIVINALETNVKLIGNTDNNLNAELTKTCVDEEEDMAQEEVENIFFVDSVFQTYVKLDEQTVCFNCRCGKQLTANAPNSMQYEINMDYGTVTVDHMTGTGRIENAFGKVMLNQIRGSVKIKATGTVLCEYIEAGLGDTVIIDNFKDNIVLQLPEDVSATFDLETTNGVIRFVGFYPSYTVDEPNKKIGTIGSSPDRILIRIKATPYSGESDIDLALNEI